MTVSFLPTAFGSWAKIVCNCRRDKAALATRDRRDYLRGRTWEERRRIGLEALIEFEALKP